MTRVSVLALVLAMMCSLAHEAAAQQGRGAGRRRAAPEAPAAPVARTMPQAWADALSWRPIGPANMGGRITALAVYEADPKIWWAATASGGLLKTTDDGISFEHQFEHEAVASIGDVAVAQSDPNVVWVGTGENNPRNSVSWGNGVYKSTDGGKTFLNMGLTESYQIGRIAIHPTDPNVVYVGALGRLWGPNDERGLYKTIDGGKTWRKILWEDENTGVIEVQLQPGDPETLLVATYERRRDGFDTNDPALKHGEKSAIYKSSDGGKTFRKITNGLPTSKMGRFGIDYYRKDPNIVYALVECEKIGMEPENAAYLGLVGENAEVGAKVTELTEGGPAEKAGLKIGDIILDVGDEKVLSYQELIRAIRKKAAGDTVAIQLSRDRKPLNIDLTFGSRPTPKEPEEGRGNNRPA
ncbi:MAG: PDZ domain-containing protein, partial [Planctomycetes bacterium]|nr:PDZ domain-containing protein [Planctomycetota bacterium]